MLEVQLERMSPFYVVFFSVSGMEDLGAAGYIVWNMSPVSICWCLSQWDTLETQKYRFIDVLNRSGSRFRFLVRWWLDRLESG